MSGGDLGDTLGEIVKPTYCFDEIYFFEPLAAPFREVSARFPDARIKWCPFGLSDCTDTITVEDRSQHEPSTASMVGASDFFHRFIAPGDLVLASINSPGNECNILHDLMDTGEIHKLAHVIIHSNGLERPDLADDRKLLFHRFDIENFDRFEIAKPLRSGEIDQDRIASWLSGLPSREDFMSARP